MLRSIAKKLQFGVEKYIPDSFIFAAILSFIVFVAGIVGMKETPLQMLNHWYGGFYGFLEFGMQMVLILVLGFTLAKAPIVRKFLDMIANLPKKPKGALMIVMVSSFVLGWVNWGLGMIAGPLIARRISKRIKVDYPILIAGAYTGWMAGIAGLSAAAAIISSAPGHLYEEIMGVVPISETIFSVMWISALILGIIAVIWVFVKMMPKEEESIIVDLPDEEDDDIIETSKPNTLSDRLNSSKIIKWGLTIMGLFVIGDYFITNGFNLSIGIIIFILIVACLALHKTPVGFVKAFLSSIGGSAGIILQFPFYGGIQGMMFSSGLALTIAEGIVSIATVKTLPLFNYISAAVVNFFVPSAGGQWLVQGGIVGETISALGLPAAYGINAFTFGDLVTNLIQPFWALPVLGVAGLKIKDIYGYLLIGFMVLFVVWGACIYFLMGF